MQLLCTQPYIFTGCLLKYENCLQNIRTNNSLFKLLLFVTTCTVKLIGYFFRDIKTCSFDKQSIPSDNSNQNNNMFTFSLHHTTCIAIY